MAYLSNRKRPDSVPISLPPISPNLGGNHENTQNLNNILVITKNDLDRIQGHLNKHQMRDDINHEELQRKKDLHQKSLALTRNWNNTIEGSRRHKLQQKAIREDKLEKERVGVDVEFAKVMAEERKKDLEKAKLLQYHETDKVKSFHSAMKLSEVLKEREAQIELKKLVDQIKAEQDDEIIEKFNQLQSEKDKNEFIKCQKKQQATDELRSFHLKQMQLKEKKNERAREEVERDGEVIAELNEQYRLEKDKLALIRQKKMLDLKEDYDHTLENKYRNREAEQIIDEEENDELRVYAQAKKKMAIMKRQKELALMHEKEEQKERMISKIGLQLKAKDSDEEFRIAKALAKREAKEYNDELVKSLKYERDTHAIQLHRKETMQMKEDQMRKQEDEDKVFMKKKMETDQLYQVYEHEKQRKRQIEMNQVSKTNNKLIKDRKDIATKERFLEKEYIAKEMELIKIEDKQFEQYSSNVIDYMDKHGRNTYPMKKCVYNQLYKGVKNIENEADLIKKHQNDVKTKKNLGFM